ncbi:MAG: hypothetical protein NTU49_03800, partial [Gammaproteobacteria bacterium]|nr:hypothetical protein [Gammaproteobacteria bacterium]
SFDDARIFVHALGLNSKKAWAEYCKNREKPSDIPSNPSEYYKKNGWESWGDWLGTGSIASFNKVFRSFEESKIFAHTLLLKNSADWKLYAKSDKKPDDIPISPHLTYKNKGWVSWDDWLGKK